MRRRVCCKCGKRRLLKFFYKRSDRPCGVQGRCKTCRRTYTIKAWKKRDKAEHKRSYAAWYKSPKGRAWVLKQNLKAYKMTPEKYRELEKKQKKRCAICLRKTKRLQVDHNHKTKQNRGLLCGQCNTGIGMLRENTGILKRAINYIQKWRRK